jgi:hypothetical protein
MFILYDWNRLIQKPAEEIERKVDKERYVNAKNIVLQYADKEHIDSLYNDPFRELVAETIVTEEGNEISGGGRPVYQAWR